MKSGDVNRAIRGPEWFDFGRFPQAEFHAEDIRRVAPGRYLARGVLSLKGVKKDLEVPFAWQESAGAATIRGKLNVERLQFGIGTGEWANGAPSASACGSSSTCACARKADAQGWRFLLDAALLAAVARGAAVGRRRQRAQGARPRRGYYRDAAERGASVYRVEPGDSLVVVRVYRGGRLAFWAMTTSSRAGSRAAIDADKGRADLYVGGEPAVDGSGATRSRRLRQHPERIGHRRHAQQHAREGARGRALSFGAARTRAGRTRCRPSFRSRRDAPAAHPGEDRAGRGHIESAAASPSTRPTSASSRSRCSAAPLRGAGPRRAFFAIRAGARHGREGLVTAEGSAALQFLLQPAVDQNLLVATHRPGTGLRRRGDRSSRLLP